MAASTVTLLLFLSAFALATPFRSRYDYTVWVLSISVLLLTTFFGMLLTDVKSEHPLGLTNDQAGYVLCGCHVGLGVTALALIAVELYHVEQLKGKLRNRSKQLAMISRMHTNRPPAHPAGAKDQALLEQGRLAPPASTTGPPSARSTVAGSRAKPRLNQILPFTEPAKPAVDGGNSSVTGVDGSQPGSTGHLADDMERDVQQRQVAELEPAKAEAEAEVEAVEAAMARALKQTAQQGARSSGANGNLSADNTVQVELAAAETKGGVI